MPCEYVNIWLKEQIKKISNAKYNASEFFKTLNSHDLSKSFVNGLCEKEINDIDDSLYNNFQFLHNLYYNLNKYENIAITDDLDNCVAANQCAESYESKVSICKLSNPSPFCKQLIKFKEQYNRDLEFDYGCKNIKKKNYHIQERKMQKKS